MSIEQIKAEVAVMPEEQQNQLMAYMIHLRHERDPQARREITQRNDDHDPSHWITPEQLKEHWKK
jgi:hypothetical protein